MNGKKQKPEKPLTVKQLIKKLQTAPPNALVVIDAQEGEGYDTVGSIGFNRVVPGPENEWYYGELRVPPPDQPGGRAVVCINTRRK